LDIGVLGYIGIVWPKEHSPEVSHIPPVTPCIYFISYFSLWNEYVNLEQVQLCETSSWGRNTHVSMHTHTDLAWLNDWANNLRMDGILTFILLGWVLRFGAWFMKNMSIIWNKQHFIDNKTDYTACLEYAIRLIVS